MKTIDEINAKLDALQREREALLIREANQEQPCSRAVVVVDRGWIFAGDVKECDDRIVLSRAVWVFRWERIGFSAVVADPSQDGVDIRPVPEGVDIPAQSEIFRVSVDSDWGLSDA